MKKFYLFGLLAVLALVGVVFAADDTSSKQASGTASATVLFDALPQSGWTVKGLNARSDAAGAKVTIQARKSDSIVFTLTSNALSTATILHVTGTTGLSTNDLIYFKPTALSPGFVCTGALFTSSTITLQAPGLVTNLVSGDPGMEIGTVHTFFCGATNTSPLNFNGDAIIQTIGNSPLRSVITGTTDCEQSLSVTKEKR
jgi:hypothetical protein